MIDLQKALVADHIADLERERAALRAERARDHVRAHLAAGTEPTDEVIDHVATALARRARVGAWLVALGQAIAGRAITVQPIGGVAAPDVAAAERVGAGAATVINDRRRCDDPCADGTDQLSHAA